MPSKNNVKYTAQKNTASVDGIHRGNNNCNHVSYNHNNFINYDNSNFAVGEEEVLTAAAAAAAQKAKHITNTEIEELHLKVRGSPKVPIVRYPNAGPGCVYQQQQQLIKEEDEDDESQTAADDDDNDESPLCIEQQKLQAMGEEEAIREVSVKRLQERPQAAQENTNIIRSMNHSKNSASAEAHQQQHNVIDLTVNDNLENNGGIHNGGVTRECYTWPNEGVANDCHYHAEWWRDGLRLPCAFPIGSGAAPC